MKRKIANENLNQNSEIKKNPRVEPHSDRFKVYEAWLRARDVTWSPLLQTTDVGVIAGTGVLALNFIASGTVICRIPKAACFGAPANSHVDDEPSDGDSQKRLAELYLKEKALGDESEWKPFLDILQPAQCPYLWSSTAQSWLLGTDLSPVLSSKTARLNSEHNSLVNTLPSPVPYPTYLQACSLISSVLNPWYGGTLTPFNVSLNCSSSPSTTFTSSDDYVIGVTSRDINKGEEITHAYCSTRADLIYR